MNKVTVKKRNEIVDTFEEPDHTHSVSVDNGSLVVYKHGRSFGLTATMPRVVKMYAAGVWATADVSDA